MDTLELSQGYFLRSVGKDEFNSAFEKLYDDIFSETVLFNYRPGLSDAEKADWARNEQPFSGIPAFLFLVEKDGEAIGWHKSLQTDAQTLNMSYSGLVPKHRGKGLYSAIVPAILKVGREQGFQRVTSKHLATNNAVLVPKLKAGFQISGFEISEKYGVLVTLVYHYNSDRRRALEFRTGEKRLPSELAARISLLED